MLAKFHVLFNEREVILADGHLFMPFRQDFMFSSMNKESFWPVAMSSCHFGKFHVLFNERRAILACGHFIMPFRQKFHVLFDKRRVILACGHLITPFRQNFMFSSMNEGSFWPVAISSCHFGKISCSLR